MISRRVLGGACAAAAFLTACHRPQPPMDEHMAHMAAGDLGATTVSASMSQGDMSLPPSANTAPARLKASNRHSEWVKIPWEAGSKDSLMAFIVYPTTSNAKTPVVVVIHEIFGLQTWIRGVADQLASQGYIAIAPDLLSRLRGGPSADELPSDSARKLINNVSQDERNKGISAAARYAMSQPSADQKYAVIGFCAGGTTAWYHAINGGATGFAGAVAYYGLPPMNGTAPVTDSLKKITKPVMLLSGSNDGRISAGMPGVDSAMVALRKQYSGKNYEGAEHGFLRVQGDPKTPPNEAMNAANVAATKDAWPRTLAFLKANLGK